MNIKKVLNPEWRNYYREQGFDESMIANIYQVWINGEDASSWTAMKIFKFMSEFVPNTVKFF